MAVQWQQVIRAAALKCQAIAGSSSATVQSAYITSPITTTQIDSPDFPLAPLQDVCIQTEERIVTAVANYVAEVNGELFFHPYRTFISGVTDSIASGDEMPSVDDADSPIVGVPGLVRDADGGTVLSRLSMAELRAILRNANDWVRSEVYACAFNGNRLYHTRDNAVVDVCVYNRTTQTTAIATPTNPILLADALEETYVNGMVSLIYRDDSFLPQAQRAKADFDATLENIGAGLMALAKAA